MKSSPVRRVYHTRSFTNGGNNSTTSFVSLIRSRSVSSSSSSSSFVVNFLINSCGLSRNQAITASKKLNFKSSANPDSVLNLVENYGFTKPYISKLIMKTPLILLSNPQETLKPIFDFFYSKGLTGIHLAKFISSNPSILERELRNIMLSFDMLRNIVPCDKDVISITKRCSWLLSGGGVNGITANIQLLRDEGVPESNVFRLLTTQSRTLMTSTVRFKEAVEEIKGMGFHPLKVSFLRALKIVAGFNKSNRESKIDNYRRLGWSDEEIRFAFKKHPDCMGYSEIKITATMDYLVHQMGFSPSLIAKTPDILGLNLERRIIPRCSVYKNLITKGLVKKIALGSLLRIVDESFLERFVTKFRVQAHC